MTKGNLQKLLFKVVRSEALVKEFLEARYEIDRSYPKKFSTFDHEAVEFTLKLLNQLSNESIALKLGQVDPKITLPNLLHHTDLTQIARNRKWTKYETGFFGTGFYVSEAIKQDCIELLYPDSLDPMFTISYFPILETVLEIEKLLLKSDLFSKSHRTYYYDTADCFNIINWLKRMELPLPQGLEQRVIQFHKVESSVATEEPEQTKNLNPKERTSMLVLIHAMAKGKFSYVEGKNLGRAKLKIYQAILDAGLDMSERTIGEYLKKAQKEADSQREKSQ